jgi:hypothetical protein
VIIPSRDSIVAAAFETSFSAHALSRSDFASSIFFAAMVIYSATCDGFSNAALVSA